MTAGFASLFLVLSLSLPLSAQTAPPAQSDRPSVTAERTSAGVTIDGRLDESAWGTATPVSDFRQVDPDEGHAVSERTEARVLFDSEALYIGVRLHDRGNVNTRLGRRDMALLDSDWFGVVIDSYHDHRTGFVFDVNPSGVQRDAIKSVGSGGGEGDDNSWDGVWDVATSIDDGGWTAEYRIPFSQLRFTSSDAPVWGIQLERVIGRRKEYAVSSFTPKAERGGIAEYGHLEGLRDIEAGQPLEVLPYVVGRAEYVDPGSNPFRTDSDYFQSAGVDLSYRVSSQLTLNATLNPDFGQVEVDPAIINLSVYETFFEEKRPFFIEGSEIFNFGRNTSGGQLFYSRRVGRRPQGSVSSAADIPEATSILGAGKLSGKTQSGWSVGLMEAVTAEENARYMDGAGLPGTAVVEPLTNYLVARIRKDGGGGRSALGGMLTATNRSLGTDVLRESLRESAYAGGVDFRHEFSNRAWAVSGGATGSRVAGDPLAIRRTQTAGNHFFQRPDAEHLDVDAAATSLTGYSMGLGLAKQAGEHWRGDVAIAATSPAFEVNDLGFQTRTDRRDLALNGSYRENRPGSFFRQYSITGRIRYEHNYSNQRILNIFSLQGTFQHLNWWGASVSVNHFARANDDRSTRGGPLMERPANTGASVHLFSDPRKSVTYFVTSSASRDAYGGWGGGVGFNVGLKTSPRWSLAVTPNFSKGLNQAQYIGQSADPAATETFGARYLFAPLHQTTLSVETRFDFTFTPRLSFQLFAQPFISSGDYGAAGSLARPASYVFDPYLGSVPDRDFNLRSLRGTAVLRWEWRSGSTLYLAWQQTRDDFATGVGDFDFGRDRRALFATDPDNVFVLKMNYWFSPG